MKEQHDILTGMLNCTEAASILLAMTTSLADENALKELLQKQGYKFAVTELGGDASKSEFREKISGKVAIVRGNGWIAVTFYGDSAAHYITNHKRMGFGIMHI